MPNREKISEMQPVLYRKRPRRAVCGKVREIDPPQGIHMYLICRADPNSPPPAIWQICLYPIWLDLC